MYSKLFGVYLPIPCEFLRMCLDYLKQMCTKKRLFETNIFSKFLTSERNNVCITCVPEIQFQKVVRFPEFMCLCLLRIK